MAKILVLTPIRHDGLDIDPGEELDLLSNEQAERLAAAGAAQIVELDKGPKAGKKGDVDKNT